MAPFRFSICGLDELARYRERGVSHLISILDPGHPMPPDWSSHPEEARLELRFHDVIEEDEGMVAPMHAHIETLFAFGADLLHAPADSVHLLVHCHAGVSRSTAATILLLASARPEADAHDIVRTVADVRRNAWPNLRMIEIGDELLGRGGELIGALRTQYRALLRDNPGWRDVMLSEGRDREIASLAEDCGAVEGGQPVSRPGKP